MNVAMIIGRSQSKGLPGKNLLKICGRACVEYPILAASHSSCIDQVVVSTDSPGIKDIARKHGASVVDRPEELCRSDVSPGDVFRHALETLQGRHGRIKYIALLYANAVNVLPTYIDQCVALLDRDPSLDSAVTVAEFNMFTPLRARRLTPDGGNTPFVDFDEHSIKGAHDRSALGDCFYMTCGAQVVRERCLLQMDRGGLPYRWLGAKIGTVVHDFGFDIDAEWQVPVAEYWLRKHGFTETTIPFETSRSLEKK